MEQSYLKDEMLGWQTRYLKASVYIDQLTAAIHPLRVRFERARRDGRKPVWYNIHIRLMSLEGVLNAVLQYGNLCVDEMHKIRIYQDMIAAEAEMRRASIEMAESGMTQSE